MVSKVPVEIIDLAAASSKGQEPPISIGASTVSAPDLNLISGHALPHPVGSVVWTPKRSQLPDSLAHTTVTPVSEPFGWLHAQKKRRGYDGGHDRSIKLVIVGDSGVGKTCLMDRFVHCCYFSDPGDSRPKPTTTVDAYTAKRYVDINKRTVELEIGDTAGMEKHFNAIPNIFFRNAEGVILVFDVTNQESFTHVKNKGRRQEPWVSVIQQMCETASILLVGHKCDSDDKDWMVKTMEAQKIAKQYDMIDYIEASSQDDINVDQIFYKITQDILTKHPQDRWPQQQQPLPQPQPQQQKKSCRC